MGPAEEWRLGFLEGASTLSPTQFKNARHTMQLSRTDMATALATTRRSVERMEAGSQHVSPIVAAHINTLLELHARDQEK